MRFGSFFDRRVHQRDHALGARRDAVPRRLARAGPVALGPLWVCSRCSAFLVVFIWIRATLPRLRYDQLMAFGWKVLLPLATLNALGHRRRGGD